VLWCYLIIVGWFKIEKIMFKQKDESMRKFPAKKTDKCRCETERWVTVDGNGSRKRSDFVIDDDPSTCSNGCCEKLKCKLCGRNSWSSKPIEKLLNRSSKNTTSW